MRWFALGLVILVGCLPDTQTSPNPIQNRADTGIFSDLDSEVEDTGSDVAVEIICEPVCTVGVCDPTTNSCVECRKNDDCSGAKAVCNTVANICVGCFDNSHCAGDTSVCDTASRICVGCVGVADCGATQVCDASTRTCVECLGNGDCASEGVCDFTTNTCVKCLNDADCDGSLCRKGITVDQNKCVACNDNSTCQTTSASRCDINTNTCSACADAGDCSHIAGTSQCSDGKCVECTTATEAADCFNGLESFSCDVATNTCSNIQIGSRYRCGECVSSSSCGVGFTCVPTQFSGVFDGNYCMQLFNGAPCPQPYGGYVSTRNDINGNEVQVCLLKEALISCESINQYGAICNGNDALCTAKGGVCKQYGQGTRSCTYSCISEADCKNTVSCNAIASGKFCGATGS